MSSPLQINLVEANHASGNGIGQFSTTGVDAAALGRIAPGQDVQLNIIQQNAASGNDISQAQFTNIDALVHKINANPNVGDVQVNFIGANQASGNNINQTQVADIGVASTTGKEWASHSGHQHHGQASSSGGDIQANIIQANQASGNNIGQAQNLNVDVTAAGQGSSWGNLHHGGAGDAQVNVIQANQASGNNIGQSQFANVDVTAVGQSGHHHGHHHGYNHHHDHAHWSSGDAQVNVIQANQASGNNIGQSQSANVNVDAFAGHNGWSHHHSSHWSNGDSQVNVIQANQASGNNIDQIQSADVDVTAVGTGSASGWNHHHQWSASGNGAGDSQINVVQANQASGNNIGQFQNADIDVASFVTPAGF